MRQRVKVDIAYQSGRLRKEHINTLVPKLAEIVRIILHIV